jgi:hypothetical protein
LDQLQNSPELAVALELQNEQESKFCFHQKLKAI